MTTRPPGGARPPEHAQLASSPERIALMPLAEEVCRRYRDEFPDEEERYGPAGMAWCVHDNQHIFNWAIGDHNGYADLQRELAWLAGVLEARAFPLERLARNLEIAADVAGDEVPEVAGALSEGARMVRSRGSFLS